VGAFRFSACLVAGFLVTGCGGGTSTQSHGRATDIGDVRGEPAVETLPPYRHVAGGFTERMKFGLILAEQSFLIPPPQIPATRDTLTLQDWGDTDLAGWLETTTQAVVAARRELDAAAEEEHRQRILAGAVVGLMYEHVARVLRSVPRPDDLDDEPEIADAYEYVVQGNAAPFVEHARRAYRACAANAIRPEEMNAFSHFCEGRRDRLPAPHQSTTTPTTEVTVIADRD
jgi:hypothetical protein